MDLSEIILALMERARRANMTFEQFLEWLSQNDREDNETPWEE